MADISLINVIKNIYDFGLSRQADEALKASIEQGLNQFKKKGMGRLHEQVVTEMK